MMHVEQLVYGTFDFTQGFTLVSTSAGISAALAREAEAVCKGWGEILSPRFRSALYHVPLAGGEIDPAGEGEAAGDPAAEPPPPAPRHLIGKVVRQGTDRGDRMAWYHQVLVLSHADYLAAGGDCFAFEAAGFFKDRWFESDRALPLQVDPGVLPGFEHPALAGDEAAVVRAVLAALAEGSEVRLPVERATRSVLELMRTVLHLLPPELRTRLSLATFAYRPMRRYDFWSLHDQGGATPAAIAEVPVRRERPDRRAASLAHAPECAADWQRARAAGERLGTGGWDGVRELLDRPAGGGKDAGEV